MQCTFCNDQCCDYGADIDMLNVDRIMNYRDELEKYTHIRTEDWFYKKRRRWDAEYPGHVYTRTTKKNNACIFHNPKGKGCMLHSFALDNGIDYHELKPFFCSVFPVTYFDGVLMTPEEIDEKSLACMSEGYTLYQGAREEIKYYFGEEIVGELDVIESEYKQQKKSA